MGGSIVQQSIRFFIVVTYTMLVFVFVAIKNLSIYLSIYHNYEKRAFSKICYVEWQYCNYSHKHSLEIYKQNPAQRIYIVSTSFIRTLCQLLLLLQPFNLLSWTISLKGLVTNFEYITFFSYPTKDTYFVKSPSR